jgi:hypothetical protein
MRTVQPWQWSLFAGLIIICLLFILMSRHEYPLYDGDSKSFLPIAISLSQGHGLARISVSDAAGVAGGHADLPWH